VTESLRSRSDSCRLLGVRWAPRTRRVVRCRANGYDESLLPTSVLHPFKGLARRTINSSGSSTVQVDSNLTSQKVELIQNFVEKRQVLGEADGC
jgi:hypothetical protein